MGVAHLSDLANSGGSSLKRIVLVVLLLSPAVSATTVLDLDLYEIVHRADRGFLATVIDVRSEWCDAEARAYTNVTFRVERDLLGNLSNAVVSLRLLGGTAERPDGKVLRQHVHGMPEFEPGERAIVFALDDARLYCPVVGWYQGCYRVRLDVATGEDRVYDNDGLPVTSLSTRDVKVSAEGPAVTLAAFLAKVEELRVAPEEARGEPPAWIERTAPCAEVALPAGGGERARPRPEAPRWPVGVAAVMVALGVILGMRRR